MPNDANVKKPNVEGFELTEPGMSALFAQMGYPNITTGSIYKGSPIFSISDLEQQGFMPLSNFYQKGFSGHWIMLIKGKGNSYHLFDPLGEISGSKYVTAIKEFLPADATLDVIPIQAGIHAGLMGYWVASAGMRARNELIKEKPPTLQNLGKEISQSMIAESTHLLKIKKWLASIVNNFFGPPASTPTDASELRSAAEKASVIAEATGAFSLYTDPTIQDAIQWAYDKHLGTPYKPGNMEATPAHIDEFTIYRQTHGLAHTLRTMAYSQVIVEEARKAKLRGETLGKFQDGRTIADVTPEELKKIMIAQAFFVAGREGEESDNDNYVKYHELSKKAFLDYVAANPSLIPSVYKDQKEVDWYADVIEDKGKKWEASPAHVLINQSHMVDLVRVKQPPESFLERYFTAMKRWIDTKATEAVFAQQREFFRLTKEVVTAFDSNNTESHLVVNGLGRHVMKDGLPVRIAPQPGETIGQLEFIPLPVRKPDQQEAPKIVLKPGETVMTVKEYLALPEVKERFPGAGKSLDGSYDYSIAGARGRAQCETNVEYCLKQLQKAQTQVRQKSRDVLEKSTETARRQPSRDEIAAAAIIKQILNDPSAIKTDHVSLNGKTFDEAFFRKLLKNCDMVLVGSLLDTQDMRNVKTLITQESDTEFHQPGTEPVITMDLGLEWARCAAKNKSKTPEAIVSHSLVQMMQENSAYSRRINEVSQGVDQGSTFKEVLLSAVLMPVTQKALTEIQPTIEAEPPKKIYYKLGNLSDGAQQKLLGKAQSIIANTTSGLFTDATLNAYNQIQGNNITPVFGKSYLTTAGSEKGANLLGQGSSGQSLMIEIEDPDGVLGAQRVNIANQDSEQGYSVYLPEDVGLIPVEVIKRSPPDADLVRVVAVKSPDFIPRHNPEAVVTPYLELLTTKFAEIQNSVISDRAKVDEDFDSLIKTIETQANKPVRDFFSRLAHRIFKTDDGMISLERQNFYKLQVLPALKDAQIAYRANDKQGMLEALGRLPFDNDWKAFVSHEAVHMHAQVIAIKQNIRNQLAIHQEDVAEQLRLFKEAIDVPDINSAFEALPEHGAWENLSTSAQLRDLRTNLSNLASGIAPSIPAEQCNKEKIRYEAVVTQITEQITTLEKNTGVSLTDFAFVHGQIKTLLPQIEHAKAELKRISPDPNNVDMTALNTLLDRVQAIALSKGTIIVSQITYGLKLFTTPEIFKERELTYLRAFEEFAKLQEFFPDSAPAREQKAKIVTMQKEFEDLQKGYPKAMELRVKTEQLLCALLDKCHSNLKGLKAPTSTDDNLYNQGWALLGYESENLAQMKFHYRELMATRTLLGSYDDPEKILRDLSAKSATHLEKALHINPETAVNLLILLKQAFANPQPKFTNARATANLDTIDKVLSELNAPEVKPDIAINMPEDDDNMQNLGRP
jgi:hypothetical protein